MACYLYLCFYLYRVVVEPARGTARGSGGHRERYDRYDRRGGGGRFNDK